MKVNKQNKVFFSKTFGDKYKSNKNSFKTIIMQVKTPCN